MVVAHEESLAPVVTVGKRLTGDVDVLKRGPSIAETGAQTA